MSDRVERHRDLWAGGLMALIGLGTVVEAYGYDIGSLTEMGPGFLPMVLGFILIGVGALIAVGVGRAEDVHIGADLLHAAPGPLDWRGGGAIVAGVAAFILLGTYAGLLPAVFACVFIAAMGDRTTSWQSAGVLALLIAVIGSLVFVYGLKIQFPLLRW